MKVLWVVGFVVPKAAHLAGGNAIPYGGWVSAMVDRLAQEPCIELGVAMRAPVKAPVSDVIGGVKYYALPQCGRQNHDVSAEDCRYALDDFRPDLLHVEGTESTHAHTFLSCWEGKNVVELQGIINGHEIHQYGGSRIARMLLSLRPTQMIPACSMVLNKHLRFLPRLQVEVATMGMAQNLLGRTNWDRAHSYALNHRAKYYLCHHVLRSEFYQEVWSLEDARRHRLFVGNAASPLKGAHFAVLAVNQLRREYPGVELVIAGESPYPSSWREYKKHIGYPAYLRGLVEDLDLKRNVTFVGRLGANEMALRMCSSHAYVLCSTIENSPTTLGEAMVMGVPSVTAYAGGTPDLAQDGQDALFYRDNEPAMLAYQIKRIFDDDELALRLSGNARQRALITYDPKRNLHRLIRAYVDILGDDFARMSTG